VIGISPKIWIRFFYIKYPAEFWSGFRQIFPCGRNHKVQYLFIATFHCN